MVIERLKEKHRNVGQQCTVNSGSAGNYIVKPSHWQQPERQCYTRRGVTEEEGKDQGG